MAHLLQGLSLGLMLALVLQGADTKPAAPLKPFSHKKHLALGNIAPVIVRAIDKGTYLSPPGKLKAQLANATQCEACHRGLRDSDEVTPANMPKMADCLVCHDHIEPPFSCATCHTKDAKLKPATHTADFLDTHPKHVKSLEKGSCAVCHGQKFTCLGCH